MLKVRMIGSNIAIEPDEIPTTTESGLELVTRRQEFPTEGVVIAVGPGVVTLMGERIPPIVQVGDRVAFEPTTCSQIGLGDQRIFILDEDLVLAILEDQ